MDKIEILERYESSLASSGKTRNLYTRFAREFIEFSDGDFSREMINKYLEHLKRKHRYSDGSINFAFRVVRTMHSRSLEKEGVEWPFRRGESPGIREDKIKAPALHPQTLGKMIHAIRENGQPAAQAFLALSTTYGLRRTEMVELNDNDIRLKDHTIHITTAKHGRERTHLIPEVIIPYLKAYNFSEKRSENFLFSLWYQVEISIGMKHTDQVGWHSIRRSLNTMLMRSLPESTVMSFLRWKQRTSSHMPYRYSAQRFVGEEGESTEVVGDALDVDNEIFRVHPFLSYWG